MALLRYRYESLALNIAELQNHVPGMPTAAIVSTPTTIDVTVDESSAKDLDDYLTGSGWKFIGQLNYP